MTRMWPTVGSVLAAFALVAILVAPAFAGEHGTALRDGSFSPGSGTTSTRFTFSVTYQDDAGRPPYEVDVSVGSDHHRLHWSGGHDWQHGVRFDWSGTLPAGTQAVTFQARTQHHDQIRVSAGSVSVSSPPTPSPIPTAHPTPHPTPRPTAKPAPDPTPRPAPHHTAAPTTRPHDHPTADPTGSPSPAPSANAEPSGSPGDGIGGSAAATPAGDSTFDPSAEPTDGPLPSDSPAPSDDSIAVAGPVDPADGQGDTTAPIDQAQPSTGRSLHGGPLAAILTTIGVADPELPVLPLIPTVMTTSGAAVASMALGLFGRRRRTDEQPAPDAVLAAAAAAGIGVGEGAAQGVSPDPGPDEDLDADLEALLPRWRRPSLLQARRADPLRTDAAAPRLSFDHGFAGSLAGLERRMVRYTVVRLLDAPDELRGREIGAVGEGDEVGLLEKHGSYWLVQCPNGGKGWLHQMTLGTLEDGGSPAGGPATLPGAATMPAQNEPLTGADSDADIDDDVLAAYLASRRRAG